MEKQISELRHLVLTFLEMVKVVFTHRPGTLGDSTLSNPPLYSLHNCFMKHFRRMIHYMAVQHMKLFVSFFTTTYQSSLFKATLRVMKVTSSSFT